LIAVIRSVPIGRVAADHRAQNVRLVAKIESELARAEAKSRRSGSSSR
jgi:hypothetical protein